MGHLVYQSVHLSVHAFSPEISLVHMDVFIKDQMVKISQPRTILVYFITVNRMSVSWNRVDDVKMYHNAILSSFELRCGRNICVLQIQLCLFKLINCGDTTRLPRTWLVVLRIFVALAIFQPYRDFEAGDNQSLKFKWRGGESNPGPLAPQAKSLTTLTRPPPLPVYQWQPILILDSIFLVSRKAVIYE